MCRKRKFQISDYVWAKMKGYPPWPGKIVGAKKRSFYIFFFGTENYGWVNQKHLYPYAELEKEFTSSVKSPSLRKAIAHVAKCLQGKRTGSDDDISLNQMVSSSSEDDVPLVNFTENSTARSDKLINKSMNQKSEELRFVLVNDVPALARVKHTKGSKESANIISVSMNDKIAISKLIPRELKVCLTSCETVT